MFNLGGGQFLYSNGEPIANGTLLLTLSTSATIIATGGAAPSTYTLDLDSNGEIIGPALVYGNTELSPAGTYYYATVKSGAEVVWGPNNWAVGPAALYSGNLYPNVLVLPPWEGGGGGSDVTVVTIALSPGSAGNFKVAHGLGTTPTAIYIQMTSGGEIYFQSEIADATYLYLTASDAGITGNAIIYVPLAVVGPVSSVFGRTGSVVAASGDYDDVQITPTQSTVSYSSTPVFNGSVSAHFKITLTGNVSSSTLENVSAGQIIVFEIIEDSTGGRSFVWPSNVLGGMSVEMTPGTVNVQAFYYDGANAYALGPGSWY